MKESNEILSNVYRATPTLFQRFMPSMQPPLPLQVPLLQTHLTPQHCADSQQNSPIMHQMPNLNGQSNSISIKLESAPITPTNLSSPVNELSIDQNCTPPSSSSNSTANSVSPLDFNTFVAAAAASTPVVSPLMMPTPKVNFNQLQTHFAS